MAAIELALALLLAVLVSGHVVRALPIPLPLPIVQIALGWVISRFLHQGQKAGKCQRTLSGAMPMEHGGIVRREGICT